MGERYYCIMLTNDHWAYLVTWMDLWSRLIVGWYLNNNMRDELMITAFRRAEYAGKCYEPMPVDHLLYHGEVLPLAGGIDVIHMPGHSAGYVCSLLGQEIPQ